MSTSEKGEAYRRLLELLDRDDDGITRDDAIDGIVPEYEHDTVADVFDDLAKKGEIYMYDPINGLWKKTPDAGGSV